MLGMCSLFIPASAPRMINSGISFITDSIIFDLEDAVSLSEKDAARDMLFYALPLFSKKNYSVRINGFDSCWLEDVKAVGPFDVPTIIAPKADVGFVRALSEKLDEMRVATKIALLIESAASMENLENIAKSSPRVTSLILGAEDYCFDMGTQRTAKGDEILYARSKICTAARAFNLESLDTPFTNVNDMDGLAEDAKFAKSLGFTGKLCINPLQVEVIKAVFSPTEKEIMWARKVILASQAPENQGKGAFSADGKMVDAPILKRAGQILDKIGDGQEVDAV